MEWTRKKVCFHVNALCENDIRSFEIFEVKFREIKKKIREIKKN